MCIKSQILKEILKCVKPVMHFHFCQKYECLGAKNVVLHKLEFHRENRTHRAASGRDTSLLQHQVFRPDAARCVRFSRWNPSYRRGSRIQKGGFVQEFRLENRSYPDVHDFSLCMQVIIAND